MAKSIEELLKDQESTSTAEELIDTENTEAKSVEEYSSVSVVDLLKKSLNIHWQQTLSLTAQAVHLERWGYKKLAAVIKEDAEEEHQHAMINLARLEFFDEDYQPITVTPAAWTRHDMVAMIRYNLDSVNEAADIERSLITTARNAGDEITANMTIPLLQGSDDGIKLYESYLKLIEQMGLDNFLTLQV